jgi:hypothetical protein
LASTGPLESPVLGFESLGARDPELERDGLFDALIEAVFKVGSVKGHERVAALPNLGSQRVVTCSLARRFSSFSL